MRDTLGLPETVSPSENAWNKKECLEILRAVCEHAPHLACIPQNLRSRAPRQQPPRPPRRLWREGGLAKTDSASEASGSEAAGSEATGPAPGGPAFFVVVHDDHDAKLGEEEDVSVDVEVVV